MMGEQKPKPSESIAALLNCDTHAPSVKQEKVSQPKLLEGARKDGVPSDTSFHTYSRDATSTMKGETGEQLATEQVAYYPPTTFYNCYPVYTGSYNQLDDQAYLNAGSSYYTGSQSDYSSPFYYLPAYNPYSTGAVMSADGHQAYYSSSGYLQNSGVYGSEIMPHHYWNSTHVNDATYGATAARGRAKSALSSDVSAKTNSLNVPLKKHSILDNKPSSLCPNTLLQSSHQYSASPNYYNSILHDLSLKQLHQFGCSCLLTGGGKKFQSYGKCSSCTSGSEGGYFARDISLNSRANARMWSCNNRFTSSKKSNIHGELEATTDLTRGPRGQSKSISLASSVGDEQMGLSRKKCQYNLETFQVEYDNAKFYVIKSYSEDNIHKSIKYDVWSSTPDGNKKLDAAFGDKMVKKSESGTEYPIFLFFSVNGSGQFVGVAEMVGPVDFDKNMNFWELDKWNGAFPVKWHIIKDVPNTQLRHIILENNDNRPVTFTRDTQEIGLKQGLEMLKIFKSIAEETSVLDDFDFYEIREQSLKAKKNTSEIEIPGNHETHKLQKEHTRINDGESGGSNDLSDPKLSALVNLTKNLSLNSTPSPFQGKAMPLE